MLGSQSPLHSHLAMDVTRPTRSLCSLNFVVIEPVEAEYVAQIAHVKCMQAIDIGLEQGPRLGSVLKH